jgi:uncharacterized protein (TIGR02466 family)
MLDDRNARVVGLFPKPVLIAHLPRLFTKEEIGFMEECAKEAQPNIGNATSKRSDVLHDPSMSKIHEFVQYYVDQFFKRILKCETNAKPYVTQSWFNYTQPGRFHHEHSHPNSILSGVIYLKAEKGVDSIFFKDGIANQFAIHPKEFNEYNAEEWWLPIEEGSLFIFNSNLKHFVAMTDNARNFTRVSLAFNTFIRGDIGSLDRRTYLSMK